jgi:hypothetical protein
MKQSSEFAPEGQKNAGQRSANGLQNEQAGSGIDVRVGGTLRGKHKRKEQRAISAT